jgi:hypothetical protein
VHEYVVRFKEVSKDTGYNSNALVQQFRKGLCRPILAVLNEIRTPTLDTILDWQHKAI